MSVLERLIDVVDKQQTQIRQLTQAHDKLKEQTLILAEQFVELTKVVKKINNRT